MRLALLLASLLGMNIALAEQPLTLNTYEEPPYQMLISGRLEGMAVGLMDCIFDKMPEHRPQYEVHPLQRGLYNLKKQKIAGFFAATPNPDSDLFAELSTPLLVKRWHLYSMQQDMLYAPLWAPGVRIGVLSGGNPEQWLKEQGVAVQLTGESIKQLLEQLNKGRVDVVMADQYSVTQTLADNPTLKQPYERFFKLAPVGVYFARAFLKQHPFFLEAFNREATRCRQPMPKLSAHARDKAETLANRHVLGWSKHRELRQALAQQVSTPPPNAEELAQQDALWRAHSGSAWRKLVSSVLFNDVALQMQAGVRRYADIYNELMLTDRFGRLVAASGLTTDYYQGDESKFTGAKDLASGEVFVGELEYDDSTHTFAIPAATPLRDAEGSLLGVMIVMLNADAVGN